MTSASPKESVHWENSPGQSAPRPLSLNVKLRSAKVGALRMPKNGNGNACGQLARRAPHVLVRAGVDGYVSGVVSTAGWPCI